MATKDKPWLFRTYAGHSDAGESNALFRTNMAKGQTGLSVAFDLPTQTGYDSDHPQARGEVGKVGVPLRHLGDMQRLFEGIDLGAANTSLTINAPAGWLLALYVAAAEKQGVKPETLAGTTQNDLLKEYLSRGTYIVPPDAALKQMTDLIVYTARMMPKWNPINICSYHLQEAGASPAQQIAYALANATAVLDAIRQREAVSPALFAQIVGRVSFLCSTGIKIVDETAKMLAFTEMWDELCEKRYGITDEKQRRLRYGMQVTSLTLTEAQPENNVYRIVLELLPAVLSKKSRARAVQLPAWNEALGLPRPWDQQWSLRFQQILAYETDLLEFGDILAGSAVMEKKVAEIKAAACAEMDAVAALGGAYTDAAIAHMKARMVEHLAARQRRVESGEEVVVGVNAYTESEPSPFAGMANPVQKVDETAEAKQVKSLRAWREGRNNRTAARALRQLERAARRGDDVMQALQACARAGVTTGEWGAVMRAVYGTYRVPMVRLEREAQEGDAMNAMRQMLAGVEQHLGRKVKFLMGKPGLDGHSNGADLIAGRAREVGLDVIYEGIRQTPGDIVRRAVDEKVDVVGLSILSGSHLPLVAEVMEGLRAAGMHGVRVVVGGIIPEDDVPALKAMGVAEVYRPADFNIASIVGDVVRLSDPRRNMPFRKGEQRLDA